MKVLLINGSPRKDGNTFIALSEVAKTLEVNGVNSQILNIGNKPIQGCISCYKCKDLGYCIFRDELYNRIRDSLKDADGVIIGSPVYFAGPNGALCAILDRIFYSCPDLLKYKPGAAVVACRRGGASAAFDRLNKYFTLLNMPIVSSQYWNSIHGRLKGEALQDEEGLQTMRTLGKNMIWMLNNIKECKHPIQEPEKPIHTNFIR